MSTANPKRPRAQTKPPPRTIEDIERRAAEITQAEFDAVRTLAACLRELAVALPEGSALVYDLAKAAKSMELYVRNSGRNSEVHGSLVVGNPLCWSLLRDFAQRQATDENDR